MKWSAVVQELSNRTPQSLQDRQSLTIYNDCDEHADVADRSTQRSKGCIDELLTLAVPRVLIEFFQLSRNQDVSLEQIDVDP